MRRAWLVPAIGLALLLVIWLLGERSFTRGGGGSRGEEGSVPARAARAPAGAGREDARDIAADDGGNPAGFPPIVDGRLVYLDGTPAAGVSLHLANGRAIEVRVFRSGEHTDQTIHLVTGHVWTWTREDGSFMFAAARRPAHARSFVYTAKDPRAFVVEELFGDKQTIRARRCVKVTGRLVGHDGQPKADYWFEGRLGKPEDWHTRVLREEDTFVAAGGDLKVDTLAIADTRTKADGSFELMLAEGRNTLVFGETKADGSIDVDVTAPSTDVGELRVPGAELSGEERSLKGQVLTLAGAPHPGCDVMAWDGSVGLHTHLETTDGNGAFAFEGLRSSNVILWAVPTEGRHIDLPVQTSGVVRMPCPSPILLRAPTENEYAWARVETPGFYLFVRRDVFAAGDVLDRTDVVGLPPGPLHIYLVTERILEASLDIREPGELMLASRRFRDTTWE